MVIEWMGCRLWRAASFGGLVFVLGISCCAQRASLDSQFLGGKKLPLPISEVTGLPPLYAR